MKFGNNFDWKNSKWLPYTIATCSAVLLYYVLAHVTIVGTVVSTIWKLVLPLLIGIVIAYLINPVVEFFHDRVIPYFNIKKHTYGLALACAYITVSVVFILILVAAVPQIVTSFLKLISNFSSYVKTLENQIEVLSGNSDKMSASNIGDTINNYLNKLTTMVSLDNVMSFTSKMGSGFTNFGLGFIFSIYYLHDKERLVKSVQGILLSILKAERYERFANYCNRCNNILLRYISCSLLEALLVGVVNAVFMIIMRMDFIPLISVIVGVTNLAPTFGPIVGCLIGMFILLLVKPIYALWFLLFTLVLQTIDGYVVKPRLFGSSLGVSPLLILIFIVLGGRVLGVGGILLSIPLAATCEFTMQDIIFPYAKKERRHMKKE